MYEKKKKRPLYLEIEMDIKEKIKTRQYKAGDKMLSESQICEQYGVSRITAVRALNDLEESGYIHRVPGKGNFVNYRPIMLLSKKFYSYEEVTRERGHVPSSRTLEGKIISVSNAECASEICGKTFWGLDEEVIYIKRLRFSDGKPSAISVSYIPLYLFSESDRRKLSQMDYREINAMMYTLTYSVNYQRAIEETTAVKLAREDAALLEIDSDQAIVKTDRTTFSNNRVIEYTILYQKNVVQNYRLGHDLETD